MVITAIADGLTRTNQQRRVARPHHLDKMTVYVDSTKTPYGRMLMSHMVADSLDELHTMAFKIGLRRKWFQDVRLPHYDVSQSKKLLAINLGAVEISSKELIAISKRMKSK